MEGEDYHQEEFESVLKIDLESLGHKEHLNSKEIEQYLKALLKYSQDNSNLLDKKESPSKTRIQIHKDAINDLFLRLNFDQFKVKEDDVVSLNILSDPNSLMFFDEVFRISKEKASELGIDNVFIRHMIEQAPEKEKKEAWFLEYPPIGFYEETRKKQLANIHRYFEETQNKAA